MKFSGKFTIGQAENTRLNQYVALKRLLKNAIAIGIIVLIPQLILPYLFEGELTVLRILLAILISVAAGGLFFLIMRLSVAFRVKTFYKTETLTPFEQSLYIDSKGITATTDDEGAKFSTFDQIDRVKETKKDLYIFISATQAFVLSKSQMNSEKDDMKILKSIFSSALPADKLKFK